MKQRLIEEGHQLSKQAKDEYDEKRKNLIMTLIIAYHNAGVECEYLQKYEESEHHYQNGSDVGLKYFGQMDEMTRLLQRSLNQVKRQQASKSVQKWSKGRRSPNDVLSLTSNNSRDIKFGNTKVIVKVESEERQYVNKTANRSPVENKTYFHSKNKSYDRAAKRPLRKHANMSVMKKSHQKLLTKPKNMAKIKNESQYMKSRKTAFNKHIEFTTKQRDNRVELSNSRIENMRRSDSLDSFQFSQKFSRQALKETKPVPKLYKIQGASEHALNQPNQLNSYYSAGMNQRPGIRKVSHTSGASSGTYGTESSLNKSMRTKHQYFNNEQNSQNPLNKGKIFVTSKFR
jgi:hypothetical protein